MSFFEKSHACSKVARFYKCLILQSLPKSAKFNSSKTSSRFCILRSSFYNIGYVCKSEEAGFNPSTIWERLVQKRFFKICSCCRWSLQKKFWSSTLLGELFSRKFSFRLHFFQATGLISFIDIYLHPSSIGKCLFKVDALGTLFPDDILSSGVDVFLEYVAWSNHWRVKMLI